MGSVSAYYSRQVSRSSAFRLMSRSGLIGPLALLKGIMSKWISKAISKPGALHKQLGIPIGRKIPSKTLQKAAHASGTLGRRARLAETLGKLRRG